MYNDTFIFLLITLFSTGPAENALNAYICTHAHIAYDCLRAIIFVALIDTKSVRWGS